MVMPLFFLDEVVYEHHNIFNSDVAEGFSDSVNVVGIICALVVIAAIAVFLIVRTVKRRNAQAPATDGKDADGTADTTGSADRNG